MSECEFDSIDDTIDTIDTIDDITAFDEIAALPTAEPVTADECFERGMIWSSGRAGAIDMIAAHMWFNIAAMWGNKDAAAVRREIAQQMSDAEIGAAQKAARDWLKAQPVVLGAAEPMRVAA
jgi:hypothetical protein